MYVCMNACIDGGPVFDRKKAGLANCIIKTHTHKHTQTHTNICTHIHSQICPFSDYSLHGTDQRLAKTSFESKHPIILDSRLLLMKLFPRHLHFAHNHQNLDCLRSRVYIGFMVLSL